MTSGVTVNSEAKGLTLARRVVQQRRRKQAAAAKRWQPAWRQPEK